MSYTPITGSNTEVLYNSNGGIGSEAGVVVDSGALAAAVIFPTSISFANTAETISSGAITASSTVVAVDTQSAASTDDLDTITPGSAIIINQFLIVRAANTARTVVMKNGTGNMNLAGDMFLDNTDASITLFHIVGTGWVEVARNSGIATSGTYTPTLTGVSNVTGSVAFTTQYYVVGKMCHVFGKMTLDPTAAGTATSLRISLPVASNLGNNGDLVGQARMNGFTTSQYEDYVIFGDASNDEALLSGKSGTAHANQFYFFHFSYAILV